MDLRALVREVPDFPKPGVSFKDITTVLRNGAALRYVVQTMADHLRPRRPDVSGGVESRGFLLGAPVAYALGGGVVVGRTAGRLPAGESSIGYQLGAGDG